MITPRCNVVGFNLHSKSILCRIKNGKIYTKKYLEIASPIFKVLRRSEFFVGLLSVKKGRKEYRIINKITVDLEKPIKKSIEKTKDFEKEVNEFIHMLVEDEQIEID